MNSLTASQGGAVNESSSGPGQFQRPDYVTPGGRDLRLDLIRGFMVFAMVADHLGGDSPISLLTGGNGFFVSAAEGFVLISGLMAGLVYRRVIQRDGLRAGLGKLLGRAATLYALTITVTLIFTVFSERAGMSWAGDVNLGNPAAFVVSVVTLRQTYFLVDVPLLYTLLFLCAPAAILLLERGYGWLALAGSALIYALYQLFTYSISLPWPIARNGTFPFAAWQALFIAGLCLGYAQSKIPALSRRATRNGLLVFGIGMAVLVAFFAWFKLGGGPAPDAPRAWLQEFAFSKSALRPGRLIAAAIVFPLFFLLTTRYWPQIRRVAGWLLLPLGQHALYAYVAFIAVAGLAGVVVGRLDLTISGAPWFSTALKLAGVGLVLSLVKLRILMPTPATRRYWLAAPVIASLAIFGLLSRDAATLATSSNALRNDYRQIVQNVLSDPRPGDRVWLSGPDRPEAYAELSKAAETVLALPERPASAEAANVTLRRASEGGLRIFVLFYGERAEDPGGLYERWLADHAFKTREMWVGDVRVATYAINRALTPMNAGAEWESGIRLTSALADLSSLGAGAIIPLELTWAAGRALPSNLTIFVHLGEAEGPPVAQNDGAPVAGLRPTSSWQPGEVIVDRRGVFIEPSTQSGAHTLFVGLFDSVTGQRLKLASGADRFPLGTVTVK